MSINGQFVVARSGRPLWELAAVRSSVKGAVTVSSYVRDGDWQMLWFNADWVEVEDLVAGTQAPALTIFVLEGFVADVRGAGVQSPSWYAILNPVGGREYELPDAGPVEDVTASAVTWAIDAGLTADPGRLAAAIELTPGPFAEGVHEFLAALGFRFGAQEPVPAGAQELGIVDQRVGW